MTDEPKEEKKIIVDEDWKSRVEAEKQAAQETVPEEPEKQPPSSATEESLPPPDLTFLTNSLYLQGVMALGLLPNPISDKPEVNLPQAKHTVDTLQMLQEKTEGNRTPEETRVMDEMLHQLRLAYVAVQESRSAST